MDNRVLYMRAVADRLDTMAGDERNRDCDNLLHCAARVMQWAAERIGELDKQQMGGDRHDD